MFALKRRGSHDPIVAVETHARRGCRETRSAFEGLLPLARRLVLEVDDVLVAARRPRRSRAQRHVPAQPVWQRPGSHRVERDLAEHRRVDQTRRSRCRTAHSGRRRRRVVGLAGQVRGAALGCDGGGAPLRERRRLRARAASDWEPFEGAASRFTTAPARVCRFCRRRRRIVGSAPLPVERPARRRRRGLPRRFDSRPRRDDARRRHADQAVRDDDARTGRRHRARSRCAADGCSRACFAPRRGRPRSGHGTIRVGDTLASRLVDL